jgi:hypothetical protein
MKVTVGERGLLRADGVTAGASGPAAEELEATPRRLVQGRLVLLVEISIEWRVSLVIEGFHVGGDGLGDALERRVAFRRRDHRRAIGKAVLVGVGQWVGDQLKRPPPGERLQYANQAGAIKS